MQGLHENQKKILDYLLEQPEGAALEEIADHLGVTKTAAKEHLLKLDHHGYIQFTDVKGNVGRPRRLYSFSGRSRSVSKTILMAFECSARIACAGSWGQGRQQNHAGSREESCGFDERKI